MSKKKNKWEAKLMRARKWAFRELFDSEEEAARAYDKVSTSTSTSPYHAGIPTMYEAARRRLA